MSRQRKHSKNRDLGFVSVRVAADYGGSGLWVTYPGATTRHSGISGEDLRLPSKLLSEFADWIETYNYQGLKMFDLDAFNRRGRELAYALKAHLGPDSYVA